MILFRLFPSGGCLAYKLIQTWIEWWVFSIWNLDFTFWIEPLETRGLKSHHSSQERGFIEVEKNVNIASLRGANMKEDRWIRIPESKISFNSSLPLVGILKSEKEWRHGANLVRNKSSKNSTVYFRIEPSHLWTRVAFFSRLFNRPIIIILIPRSTKHWAQSLGRKIRVVGGNSCNPYARVFTFSNRDSSF